MFAELTQRALRATSGSGEVHTVLSILAVEFVVFRDLERETFRVVTFVL